MVLINKDVKCKQPFSFSFLLSFHFVPSIPLPISCQIRCHDLKVTAQSTIYVKKFIWALFFYFFYFFLEKFIWTLVLNNGIKIITANGSKRNSKPKEILSRK